MRDITGKEPPNEDIANFLSDLSKNVQNNKLDAKQLQLVGEFYLNYLFNEDIRIEENEEINTKNESDNDSECVDQNELVKFLSLGWYMYTFLIKDKINTTSMNDSKDAL
jgi:hypothetical protein